MGATACGFFFMLALMGSCVFVYKRVTVNGSTSVRLTFPLGLIYARLQVSITKKGGKGKEGRNLQGS